MRISHAPARVRVVVLVFVLVLVLGAPPAAAHVENYSQSDSIAAGPYLVFVDPRPQPAFAGSTVSIVAQVSSAATGGLLQDVPANVTLTGPSDYSFEKPMESDGAGYLLAAFPLGLPGNYTATLALRDGSGATHTAALSFDVYPDIPYRVRAVDQSVDIYTGVRTRLAFEIADARTLERTDKLSDLRVNMEHWTDDHSTKLTESEVEAVRVTAGVWRIDPVFNEGGMYHLRFASTAGGFNYAEVPLLHIYAIPSEDASAEDNDTPFPGVVLVLTLALGLALARARPRR